MLFCDALLDNLPPGVDANNQKSVRHALRAFRTLAREMDIAVIGSLHPNKKAQTFRQLVANSVAFNAVSRSTMFLTEDPNDTGRRVLLRGKGNLSVAPQARSFTIEDVKFTANGEGFSVSRACNFQRSDWHIKDLMEATEPLRGVAESKVGSARALLSQLLPQDGEWHPSKPIFEACIESGLDNKTVHRAKATLEIEHRRSQTFPAYIEWRWPTEDTTKPSCGGRV
jgi:hypothetical protein